MKTEKKNIKKKNIIFSAIALVLAVIIGFISGQVFDFGKPEETTAAKTNAVTTTKASTKKSSKSYSLSDIPEYSGELYVKLNNNKPYFEKSDYTTKSYEKYGKLDRLGRCTACMACIGQDLMPDGERGNISEIKPTGWHKYTFSFVDGGSLYNRSHLIAYQLTGENANPKNLITGTRTMNSVAMTEFEIKTGDYIRNTGNHVLYRVTPIFQGNEMVARGVEMEGYSVEDNGKGICFNVYCYNNEPGVEINYKTGEAWETEGKNGGSSAQQTFIINTNNNKFHRENCEAVREMKEKNKKTYKGTRNDLIKSGYEPCGICNP